MREPDLDKLFRAAANLRNGSSDEMPFGFDTRVLANWRASRTVRNGDLWSSLRVFRRLAVTAAAVALFAGSAAVWQLQQNDELDSTTNAYAIADNAIDSATWQ